MKITFNSINAVTGVITNDEPLRQGNVGANTLTAVFEGKSNLAYTATFNYTRSDDGRLKDIPLTPTANAGEYYYKFSNPWFFAVYGETTLTVYLKNSANEIVASGQITFSIEQTDFDDDPNITYSEYELLLDAITDKQDKFNLNNVRGYDTLALATTDLPNLIEGQMVIVKGDNATFYQVQSGSLVELISDKADKDGDGLVIKSTYGVSVVLSYDSATDTIISKLYASDGTLLDTHSVALPKATTTENGLMAKEDKVKIDDLPTASGLIATYYSKVESDAKYETIVHSSATYETKINSDAKIKNLGEFPYNSQGLNDMLDASINAQMSMAKTNVGSGSYLVYYILRYNWVGGSNAIVFINSGVASQAIKTYNKLIGETVWSETDSYQPTSQKGQPNGYASLDSGGKVPTAQLPSYVDDVLEYANLASFPATGSASVIYVALDTNLTYRWSGSAYVEISPSLALGETAETAYRGDRGKTAYDHSQISDGSNPHETTFSNLASKPTTLSGFGITDAINKMISITYANLKTLRDSSQLVQGQQYRITDFVTTSVQADTQSAGHAFDLIVVADDINKLNEQARAIIHSGDTYFANSKLEAWKIEYCLDNDTTRFAWADSVNGKGVIYRMIDEFNNDVPYDFKNIQFIRKITDGVLDLVDGVDTWVYTFTGFSYENNTLVDGTTLKASEYFSDEGSNLYKNNVIGIYEVRRAQEDGFDNILETLSDNVFIGRYYEVPYVEDGPAKTVLFSFNNNLGRDCYSNTFGNNCYANTFGTYCYSNTFGDGCYSNTFESYCSSNTFGNYCYSNTFESYCSSNTFGNYCYSNTFGNYCYNNTFGTDGRSNTFGNYCYYNRLVSSGTYRNNAQYIIFENRVSYIDLQASDATGTLKNIHLSMGVVGASTQNMKVITEPRDLTHDVVYRATGSEDKVA